MESIEQLLTDTYFVPSNAKLVKHSIVGDNVDCWFEDDAHQYHRCLSLEHFNFIYK